MKQLGLIGKNISYSFSKKYFEEKFNLLGLKDFRYDIFDINKIDQLEQIVHNKNFLGFNITIPYKIKIIDFLDELSNEAKTIGAVNTVHIQNGKKIGYNTDAFGFEKSLNLMKKKHHQSAIILGNGGASKAVQYVLNQNRIPFKIVSRKGELNFENLTKKIVSKHQIIIQCTPVGTFPNITDCLNFPFDALTEKHLIIDLIYNPEKTQFIKNAEKFGAKTINGLTMLHQQAEKSWEIWNK